MARVLLRIPLCLLLVAASEANEAELDFKQLDLSGEWYVLIHYKDQRSEHKSITKFKDFAWSIRQTPGLLVWESYPYVLFSDELELIRRHAMLEHLPWEPDETLWQQITGEGIVGELAGTQLQLLGSSLVRWGDFQSEFPEGTVLSRQTGFTRSYGQNPYRGYSSSDRPFLFDGDLDERFPALERVVGVTVDGRDKAYPFSVISPVGAVNDVVGDTPIVVLWGAPDTAEDRKSVV